jgi:site-specific DNA-methyltransferase (adenine-specific)
MGMSLRLAGFEMRDVVQWLYGEGFPKSHNIGKATQDEQWDGWGTALKPAYEPALLVRKPLGGTVAQNTVMYGCGGINIDASRIETDDNLARINKIDNGIFGWGNGAGGQALRVLNGLPQQGRFPSNVLIDQATAEQLDYQAGSVSRFFYCAKASKSEREAGLSSGERVNIHPTVKPIDLMRYLARLITPPHGIVLDPFMGSGSTGCACALEGFDFIGIEREPDYFEIAQRRIKHWGGEGIEMAEYPPEVEPPESDTLPLFDWLS